jgi:hypothetical protein
MKKIKAQFGVTYECYIGYTDRMGTRVRRGRKYVLMSQGMRDDYYMIGSSGKGFGIAVPRKKFASHFVPLNPLDAFYIPLD